MPPTDRERRSWSAPGKRTDTTKTAWKNLSLRVRKQQPFCTLCGATSRLEADHSPRAWARIEAGRAVRECDVTVLCGQCNLAAGSSRVGSDRYNLWDLTDGNLTARTPDPTTDPRVGGRGRGSAPLTASPSRTGRYSPGYTS